MVNLGAAQNQVTLEYLRDNGSAWPVGAAYAGPFTLAGNGGQLQLRQYTDAAMPTGRGSVVLGATGPLGAIAQIQARSPQVPSFGAYTAFTAGSSNVYVPLVAKNGSSASGLANSQIVVQNTGTSNVTFAIDFKGTPNFTLSGLTVPGKTSYYLDVTTVGGLPNNWFGAATVRATNPTSGLLAVVSNLFFGPNAMQTFNGIPSTDAGVKWLNPSFFARLSNGLSSVMTVQNVSGSQIAIGGIQASCK
jgi:hypothetical protein